MARLQARGALAVQRLPQRFTVRDHTADLQSEKEAAGTPAGFGGLEVWRGLDLIMAFMSIYYYRSPLLDRATCKPGYMEEIHVATPFCCATEALYEEAFL